MDRPDYRKEYLEKGSEAEPTGTTKRASPTSETEGLVEVLIDLERSREDRLSALARLQTLSFAVEEFRPFLGAYLEGLRAVATRT